MSNGFDEEKIEKLANINHAIRKVKGMCDYAKEKGKVYDAEINIDLVGIDYRVICIPIDARAILGYLLLQKEELENKIKGEIKNEGK